MRTENRLIGIHRSFYIHYKRTWSSLTSFWLIDESGFSRVLNPIVRVSSPNADPESNMGVKFDYCGFLNSECADLVDTKQVFFGNWNKNSCSRGTRSKLGFRYRFACFTAAWVLQSWTSEALNSYSFPTVNRFLRLIARSFSLFALIMKFHLHFWLLLQKPR